VATGRPQRRLAAILAADVVGYSRLMEDDETGTLARLKALRAEIFDPLVAAHSGRVVKLIGDGAGRVRQRGRRRHRRDRDPEGGERP
jgi:class 3 adenylate cyclase